ERTRATTAAVQKEEAKDVIVGLFEPLSPTLRDPGSHCKSRAINCSWSGPRTGGGAMSGDQDIAYTSATSLLELYRKRALSPVEVTRLLLDRLDALQPKINAFCIIDRDGALAAARASEQRWTSGGKIGRLDGVPVTIKDLMLMRGFPTPRGGALVLPNPGWPGAPPAGARVG